MSQRVRGRVLLPDGRVVAGVVVCGCDGRISEVDTSASRVSRMTDVDWSDWTIVPGFIDLQLNGAFGHDFMQDPASTARVAQKLPRYGTTAFLPTLISAPPEIMLAQAEVISNLCRQQATGHPVGARILGTHLEGPFLNVDYRGAHNPQHTRPALVGEIMPYVSCPDVRLITLAPELPNAPDLIAAAVERGIVVSAGHSAATYEQAQVAFAAGVRMCTHIFNAMAPLHHRRPGLVGAGISTPDVVVGLIADGIHLHPSIINMVYHTRGVEGLCLVSDAMQALGQPPGTYELADRTVMVDDTVAWLADDSNTLAGSIISMDASVRNMIRFCGCSLSEAIQIAATVPADLLGLLAGRIAVGYDADLVALDGDLHVRATMVHGTIVYHE